MSEQNSSEAQPQSVRARFKNMSRRKRIGLVVFGLVILLTGAIVGGYWYIYSQSHVSTDDAFVEGHIIPISPRVSGHVARVLVEDNEPIHQGDLLIEIDPSDYQAELDGAQASLDAATAMQHQAEVSLEWTRATTEAAVSSAQAGVSVAQAGVQLAQAQVTASQSAVRQAEADVESGRAKVAQARADVVAAQAEADRDARALHDIESLAEHNATNKSEIDNAEASAKASAAKVVAATHKVASTEADLNQLLAAADASRDRLVQAQSALTEAEASLEKARAALAIAEADRQNVAVAEAGLKRAKADVQLAQARVHQAELNLSYTRICAPESGRVTRKVVEVGQYISIGQPALSIVPPDVWVVANYKETDLGSIRPGQHVEISVDTYDDTTFDGRVDSIQKGTGAVFSLLPPQNATGNYVKVVQRVPVKIVFEPLPDYERYFLAPGMSVVPVIDLNSDRMPSGTTAERSGNAVDEHASTESGTSG